MRISLILMFSFLTAQLFGQNEQIPQFESIDYHSSEFIVVSDTLFFGDMKIVMTMVSPENSLIVDFLCRSWLTVEKNGTVLHREFYDIEPVGCCSGFFVPEEQPCKDHFVISKFGDYEGLTLIIDSSGELITLKGGSFSVSPDCNYLFSVWDSDLSGITIYDLKNKRVVLSKESDDDERYYEFYSQDEKYFISFDNASESREILVGFIDIKNSNVVMLEKTKTFFMEISKMEEYNKMTQLKKCNCGH